MSTTATKYIVSTLFWHAEYTEYQIRSTKKWMKINECKNVTNEYVIRGACS